MKRIITAVIIAFLLLLPTVSLADTKVISLTIDEAQKLAVENSKQASLDDIDIKNKQTIIDNSKYDLQFQSGDSEDNAYKENVKPLEIETNLEVAKKNRVNNINTLKLNVYKTALDIILAEKQLDAEEQKLDILKQKLDMAKAKYSQKMNTQNDVNDSQYSYDSKNIDVEKVQDFLASLYLNFKKLLNLPLDDSAIQIKDDLIYNELDTIDIELIITKVESSNISIYEKEQIIKQKQNNLDNIIKYRGQGTTNYYDAQYDLESAKIDLDDAKNNLEINIRNKDNELQNTDDKAELSASYADLVNKKFKVSEIKYKNGTISKETYLTDKQNYLDALYQKYTAIHDCNIIKAEFNNLIS